MSWRGHRPWTGTIVAAVALAAAGAAQAAPAATYSVGPVSSVSGARQQQNAEVEQAVDPRGG
jgi:hypothetical protein